MKQTDRTYLKGFNGYNNSSAYLFTISNVLYTLVVHKSLLVLLCVNNSSTACTAQHKHSYRGTVTWLYHPPSSKLPAQNLRQMFWLWEPICTYKHFKVTWCTIRCAHIRKLSLVWSLVTILYLEESTFVVIAHFNSVQIEKRWQQEIKTWYPLLLLVANKLTRTNQKLRQGEK